MCALARRGLTRVLTCGRTAPLQRLRDSVRMPAVRGGCSALAFVCSGYRRKSCSRIASAPSSWSERRSQNELPHRAACSLRCRVVDWQGTGAASPARPLKNGADAPDTHSHSGRGLRAHQRATLLKPSSTWPILEPNASAAHGQLRNGRLARASARDTLNRSRAARAVSGAATDAFTLPAFRPRAQKRSRSESGAPSVSSTLQSTNSIPISWPLPSKSR
jgi:hypothetical protein